MSQEFVDYVLKSKDKERIIGIGKADGKKEENLRFLGDLLRYSSIDKLNVDNIREKHEKEIREYEHIIIILSDYDLNTINDKIKLKAEFLEESLKFIKEKGLKIWIHPLLMSDIMEISMDSRFDLLDFLSSLEILYDKGIFEIFKLVTLHKNSLLEIFSKYVVAYALAGSQVKGRNVDKSDVDVYVIIDDTDVKMHTFEELKAKLYEVVTTEALKVQMFLNSKKVIHPQVYTLTEFWYALSEYNPVIYTFLRDGIAFYDRGTFIAWKQLLLKGILKPSREAAEKHLNVANMMLKDSKDRIRNTINSLLVNDVAVSMLTAAQAVLVRYGFSPLDPKETIESLRKVFVEEKKILEDSYAKDLEDIWKLRKMHEHGEIEGFDYKDLNEWISKAESFINRMNALKQLIDREKEKEEIMYYIEEYNVLKSRLEEIYKKSINEIIQEKFSLLGNIFEEVNQYIRKFLEGKTEDLEYNIFKEKIYILIRAFRDYLQGLVEDIISLYSFKILLKGGEVLNLLVFSDKLIVISDKVLLYDYDGNNIGEFNKEYIKEILKDFSKLLNYLDKNVIKVLDKVFIEYSIAK
ncbi:hypothetical protein BA065_00775 [Nanoarchaeota archaeon NZ13-N]|nr:MAG: hypothetical protein BA065_00775 [Nanoarchaeota archaeon NZ13-N]